MSNYDFKPLSPLDFEELVRDLLQAELGILLESFGPGADSGIDFRFAKGANTLIIQAKHYVESDFRALLKAAKREDSKVAKLKPTRYIFATSISLSPLRKAKLQKSLPSAPIVVADILGREDLNNLLSRHPNVEKKHFKLWFGSTNILERILHSGIHNRTETELHHLRASIHKFVDNESVPKSQAILEKAGTLIISGQPGVGKSTLARMLIWMHLEEDWELSVIDNIADAFTLSSDGRPRLIFFDDFLGQVQLTPDWLRAVDQSLPAFLQRVRGSSSLRLVMTTRDYVLRQAQQQSDRLSAAPVQLSELILDVGAYTRTIKARMLYNHIFYSDLSLPQRRELLADDFFLQIINHRNFNPRIVEQITSGDYVSLLDQPIRSAVVSVLANPEVLWERPYRTHLTEHARCLMLALFFYESTVSLEQLELSLASIAVALGHVIAPGMLPSSFRAALKELEGSVVAISSRRVSFSNPGVRDFLHGVVHADRLLPRLLPALTEPEQVRQAWLVWTNQKPTDAERKALTPLWVAAVNVLLARHEDQILTLLQLVVSMDTLASPDIEALAAQMAQNLEYSDLSFQNVEQVKQLVEQLGYTCMTHLPLQQLRRSLFEASARLLEEWGAYLELDTINALAEGMSECGAPTKTIQKACQAALDGLLDDLDRPLSYIRSVTELDKFEKTLTLTMKRHGVPHNDANSRIRARRKKLVHENRNDKAPEPRRIDRIDTTSDDAIRSIFQPLLERDQI